MCACILESVVGGFVLWLFFTSFLLVPFVRYSWLVCCGVSSLMYNQFYSYYPFYHYGSFDLLLRAVAARSTTLGALASAKRKPLHLLDELHANNFRRCDWQHLLLHHQLWL